MLSRFQTMVLTIFSFSPPGFSRRLLLQTSPMVFSSHKALMLVKGLFVSSLSGFEEGEGAGPEAKARPPLAQTLVLPLSASSRQICQTPQSFQGRSLWRSLGCPWPHRDPQGQSRGFCGTASCSAPWHIHAEHGPFTSLAWI